MLEEGQTLLGKYRIVRLLGEGAFGRVYQAEEINTPRRTVALKELRQDRAAAEARERFEREIEIYAYLDDPSIVRMFTSEREGDTLYLALEYLPGGNLTDKLASRPLPVPEALQIAEDIAKGLAYLHGHRLDLVHRDVYPNNILFAADGGAKLSDFGAVQMPKYSSRWTAEGKPHPGNPFYRAPEAGNTAPLHKAADVYMLGCVLWEMLTGKVYYHHQDTPPSTLRPEVSPALDALVMKAVAKDAHHRYLDGDKFLAALQEVHAKEVDVREREQRQMGQFAQYQKAKTLLSRGDHYGALEAWSKLHQEAPDFLDVQAVEKQARAGLAKEAKRKRKCGIKYKELENLYHKHNYEGVLQAWGQLQHIDPNYPDRENLVPQAKVDLQRARDAAQKAKAQSKHKRRQILQKGLKPMSLIVGLLIVSLVGLYLYDVLIPPIVQETSTPAPQHTEAPTQALIDDLPISTATIAASSAETGSVIISPTLTHSVALSLTITPTSIPTVEPGTWGVFEVCAGDTLSGIARSHNNMDVNYLAALNSISDINQIPVGLLLLIPLKDSNQQLNLTEYSVIYNDTLYSIAHRFSVDVNIIQTINRIPDPNLIHPGQRLSVPLGLVDVDYLNECVRFSGKLNNPSNLDAFLRESPSYDAIRSTKDVVAQGTPLLILGRTTSGFWFKVTTRVRSGGYLIGWLPAEWIQLDPGVSPGNLPIVSQ